MLILKIRIVYSYGSGTSYCAEWDKMTNGNCFFVKNNKGLQLFGESLPFEEADYILVINGGMEPRHDLFHKTIFIKMEPVFVDLKWKNVAKWPVFNIYGTHGVTTEEFLLYDRNKTKSFNALEWHLNITRYNLLCDSWSVNKTKKNKISAVISGKRMSPGHTDRIYFVLFAQNFVDFDVCGNWNSKLIEWNNYLGEPTNKESALLPYKYSFACENHFFDFYVTEKLVDCILSETLCFYDGASNVKDLINDQAFIKIDVRNPTLSLKIIKKAIKNNEYEKRLPFIKQERKRIIEDLSIIPRLWRDLLNTDA